MKTLAILSGGMDSTTMVYDLLDKGDVVRCLSFNYGQRHKRELDLASKTCEKLKLEHNIVDISNIHKFVMSANALTGNAEVPEGHYEEEIMKKTVVPYRNGIMLMIAAGTASTLNFDRVAYGAHSGDHAIYPDCRPEFISAMCKVMEIGDYKSIKLFTPYKNVDKGDIVNIGKKLSVDYSLTHTCYKGGEKACGKCGSCVERLEAFAKAEIKDPILYEK